MKQREVNEHEVELIQSTIEDNSDKETGIKKKKKLLKIAGTVVGAAVAVTLGACIAVPNRLDQFVFEVSEVNIDINHDGINGRKMYYDAHPEMVLSTAYGAYYRRDGYIENKKKSNTGRGE